MNTYDEIIPEFISDDDLRESLLKPVLIDEYVYATNGHIAIKIPVSKLSNTYEVNPNYPHIVELFQKRDGLFQSPRIYRVLDIFAVLKNIPQTPVEVECKNCEGTGNSQTEEDDCKKCKGSGMIPTDKMEYDWQNHKLQIGLSYFNPNYIQKMLCVAGRNGIKEIQHICGMPEGQNLFIIDGIEIIIMPMRTDNMNVSSECTFHKIKEAV